MLKIDSWVLYENRKKITLVASLIVICIIVSIVLTYGVKNYKDSTEVIIMYSKGEGYEVKEVVREGKVYSKNMNTGKETLVKYSLSEPLTTTPMYEKKESKDKDYKLFPNTKVIDPVSLGMIEEIPLTYNGDLDKSNEYLTEMKGIGWDMTTAQCDTLYCDYTYTLGDSDMRIIVNKNNFKLYRNSDK